MELLLIRSAMLMLPAQQFRMISLSPQALSIPTARRTASAALPYIRTG